MSRNPVRDRAYQSFAWTAQAPQPPLAGMEELIRGVNGLRTEVRSFIAASKATDAGLQEVRTEMAAMGGRVSALESMEARLAALEAAQQAAQRRTLEQLPLAHLHELYNAFHGNMPVGSPHAVMMPERAAPGSLAGPSSWMRVPHVRGTHRHLRWRQFVSYYNRRRKAEGLNPAPQ
ncbi:hypothetical protein ABPG77_007990 [Micractinium sp. CCAP 211/92]